MGINLIYATNLLLLAILILLDKKFYARRMHK